MTLLLDRRDEAVDVVRQAVAEGVNIDVAHAWPDFVQLHGYPPFDALFRAVRWSCAGDDPKFRD